MRVARFRPAASILALGLGLAGCGETPRPLVDMEGVDPVKHNRDLAACYDKVGKQFFSWGTDVGDCMASKGYKVLIKQ